MKRTVCALFAAVALGIVQSGCEQQQQAQKSNTPTQSETSGKFTIVAGNYPVYYYASRLAGDNADISLPVPADEDPAYWQPNAEAVKQMQQADLVVLNGATSEKWVTSVTIADSKIIDTATSFEDRFLMNEEGTTHSHGPGGEHTHGSTDFNVWLDMELAAMQAETVAEALKQNLPDEAAGIDTRLTELRTDLDSIDKAFAEATAPLGGDPILASHPVYDYFAQRYDLTGLESFHWEPGEHPADDEWQKLDTFLAENPAKIMLWEDEPLEETREALQERGITVVVFRTANNMPDSGDFVSVMRENAEALSAATEAP